MSQNSFSILQPCQGDTLAAQADDLLQQFEAYCAQHHCQLSQLVQARLYVSDAANQCPALVKHALYDRLFPTGVCSIIEQPPLSGVKVALFLWFNQSICSREVYELPDGTVAEMHTTARQRFVYQSVRFGADVGAADSATQTRRAFESHIHQLTSRGMNLKDHCHRTWIFVRDVDRHYAGVVQARNELFARQGLTSDTHYIASTGIGGASEHREALVAIDFLSVDGLQPGAVSYLHAPEYLNPTHEYGVAFERGTCLQLAPDQRCYFVSGTASIDKYGECLFRGDVLTQAGRLFLNIEKLLESARGTLADMTYFIVYLRDIADAPVLRRYMQIRFPNTPFLLTEARVCRPEWLIEVEGMAVGNQ